MDIITHKELFNYFEKDVDLFVCCSSFEERCMSIPKHLNLQSINNTILIEHNNPSATQNLYTQELLKLFKNKTEHILIDRSNPILTADRLHSALSSMKHKSPMTLLVDITTFTHESLLIFIFLLRIHFKKSDKIYFGYTNAHEYSLGEPVENKWLSKGVAEVRTVLGYSGNIISSKKMHLIILVGYEHERASRLIQILEPSVISLGYGRAISSTSAKNMDANLKYHELVRIAASTYEGVINFEFSCNDPYSTKSAIIEQANISDKYNVVVAPMNTKITTMGAALSALDMDNIQLCYAQAMNYNYNYYSSPGDKCYLFELPELFNV